MAECWGRVNRNQKSDVSFILKFESSDFEYFRSRLLNLSTYRKLPNNGIYVTPWESKFHTAAQQTMTDTGKSKDPVIVNTLSRSHGRAVKSLTRSQMGSSCASSNLADYDTFRSPGLNTSNHQTVRNNGKEVLPGERKKVTGQFQKQWPTPIKLEIWNAVMADCWGCVNWNHMGSSVSNSRLVYVDSFFGPHHSIQQTIKNSQLLTFT